MRNVRIALGQMRAVQGDTRANMKKMEAMAAGQRQEGRYHLFSGVIVYRYFVKRHALEIAERRTGICPGICEAAKERDLYRSRVRRAGDSE